MTNHARSADAGRRVHPQGGPSALAGRLRLLQSELADESPETREQLLAEEIERSLNGIAPSERLAFLRTLESHFPTWDSRVDVAADAKSKTTSATDQRELQDPSFLVSRIVELAPKLSESQKQTVIAKLQGAGLAPSNQPKWPANAEKLFREQLKLSDADDVDSARLMELAAMLAQLAVSLDQPLWRMWKEIAPRSSLRRAGDLSRTLSLFASANDGVSRTQVQQELESLRKLAAALLQAVGQVGKQFAQDFRKYSPAEIESLAKIEKKWTEKLEEACWRKYRDLASTLDESAIESSIRQNIVSYAESFLGNRR
jgi:hypothetical protein